MSSSRSLINSLMVVFFANPHVPRCSRSIVANSERLKTDSGYRSRNFVILGFAMRNFEMDILISDGK